MKNAAAPSAATWAEAIKVGEDQLSRGEGITYTPEVLREITASARNAMHGGTAPDPAVLP